MSILTTAPPVAEPPLASNVRPPLTAADLNERDREFFANFCLLPPEDRRIIREMIRIMSDIGRTDRAGLDTKALEDRLLSLVAHLPAGDEIRRYVENRRARRACGQPVEA